MTQNNVAREAGRDPSALRKSRFPALVRQIQEWREKNTKSTSVAASQPRLKHTRRDSAQDIQELRDQRDILASKLLEAQTRILELMEELAAHAKDSNVTNIRGAD